MLLKKSVTAFVGVALVSASMMAAAPSVSHAGGNYHKPPCYKCTPKPPPPKPNCDRGQGGHKPKPPYHNPKPPHYEDDDDDYNHGGGWNYFCKKYLSGFKWKKHY